MLPRESGVSAQPSRKKSENRSAKREQILDIAVRLFAERGYRATTIEDIMDNLGVTGAAFYYYFKGKEAVLAAIFDEAMTQVERELAITLEMKLRPEDALERIIATHTRVIGERRHLSMVLFHDARELSAKLARQVSERERTYTESIRDVYRDGVAQGVFIDEDPELVVSGLLGMANWVYRWYRRGRHPAPGKVGEVFGMLALRSVCSQKSKSSAV